MNITVVAVSAIAMGCVTLLGAFTAWLRYRGRGSRTDHAAFERLTDELRTFRITLEAVAEEVERLGEGQRYTTRLLGERFDPKRAGSSAPPRVATPH